MVYGETRGQRWGEVARYRVAKGSLTKESVIIFVTGRESAKTKRVVRGLHDRIIEHTGVRLSPRPNPDHPRSPFISTVRRASRNVVKTSYTSSIFFLLEKPGSVNEHGSPPVRSDLIFKGKFLSGAKSTPKQRGWTRKIVIRDVTQRSVLGCWESTRKINESLP